MVDVDTAPTLQLIRALRSPTSRSSIVQLLARPELVQMREALGLPAAMALSGLMAAAHLSPPEELAVEARPVAEYFALLAERGDEIEALAERLPRAAPLLARDAFARTREYLPPGAQLGAVRLVLLPLGFDSRTDRDSVFIDPLTALAAGEDGLRHTLAHELHHVARYWITGEDLTLMRPNGMGTFPDVGAVYRDWARWVELEGIADCASNITEQPCAPLRAAAETRQRQEDDFPSLLLRAESAAAGFGPDPSRADLDALCVGLRGVAHPIGHVAAALIEADTGRPGLASYVGRPRAFFEAYNRAAEGTGHPVVDLTPFGWDR